MTDNFQEFKAVFLLITKKTQTEPEGDNEQQSSGGLQTSLLGTPSLESMTDSRPPVSSDTLISESDHIHSHETPFSPSSGGRSMSSSDTITEDVLGNQKLKSTFAVDAVSISLP